MSRCVWKCVWVFCLAAALAVAGCRKAEKEDRYGPRPVGTLTFNKDIAPIVFKNCAGCHREGQTAPFTLLSYGEVKKRAKQITEVTGDRVMPPWHADRGAVDYANDRSLSDAEIALIRRWVEAGTPEGDGLSRPVSTALSRT